MARMLFILAFCAPMVCAPMLAATWYVRPDGGTRYSAKVRKGQCNGQADAPYPGKGVNQPCAFKDYRYLWDDGSYGNDAWVIAGGDTVILRGGPWRVGFNQGVNANDVWCFGGQGPYACTNPTIPSGTASQPTRILGENYASCSSGNATIRSKLTQIFGGYGVGTALNLSGAQYVQVECLEITRHSQCITHGSPAYPSGCRTSYPLDDYDSDGISTSTGTRDVLLQDIWDHGHTDRGIIGPIGGVVTCLRCDIGYNGMAGWDFDNGSSTPSVNGVWNFSYSTIEWNGCNQQYPAVDPIPAISCYGQSNAGYGDGVGTPPGMCLTANIDHSVFRYNTQDGLDLGHIDKGSCSLTIKDSRSYANGGGQFKWGPNENPAIFENNLVLANCLRMSAPIAGAPATYNVNLGDFCRAEDAVSFNFRQGGMATLANNTIVSYAPTTYDVGCWDASCSNSVLVFENNITLGYNNPGTYKLGGQPPGPGGFYFAHPIGKIIRRNNIFYGVRSITCPTGFAAERCVDPKLVSEKRFSAEQDLDHFDFHLTGQSPAIGAGIRVPGLQSDFSGRDRPSATGGYDIGALQHEGQAHEAVHKPANAESR